ncbi:Hypothetical predicted protein, partial [Pelobates cultripes]
FRNHFDADELCVGLLDVNIDVNLDLLGLVKLTITGIDVKLALVHASTDDSNVVVLVYDGSIDATLTS